MRLPSKGSLALFGAFGVAALAATIATRAPRAADDVVSPALDSLVSAERAFSAFSVEHGMREAFLRFLAPDGTIFRPLPMNGRKTWAADAPVPGTLIWEPIFAEVSSAGDLGYTTGPWEFRPPAERANGRIAHGHFTSVWKRQPDGRWRVAADLGIRYPAPAAEVPRVGSGSPPTLHEPARFPVRSKAKPIDLPGLDRALERTLRSKGVARGLASRAAPDLRFDTDGAPPFLGIEPARAALDTLSGRLRFRPRHGEVAGSNDLGFSYGVIERVHAPAPSAPDSIVYLHVWRRGAAGDWRLALAVWNPIRR